MLIKALRCAHDYTSQIDFTTTDDAMRVLRATNAFNEPVSDERLQLPAGQGLGG